MTGPVAPQFENQNTCGNQEHKRLYAWQARLLRKIIFRLLNRLWKGEGEWAFTHFSEFHIDRRHDFRVHLINYDPEWARKHYGRNGGAWS